MTVPLARGSGRSARCRRAAVLVAGLALLVQLLGAVPAQAATGSVTIGSASQTEGDLGSRHMTFTVTRSSGGTGTFSVSYTTHPGTALADRDFANTSGTLFFGANQTTATLTVDVLGDTLDEDDETFTVELTGPTSGVTLGTPATGTGTIVDDDAPPAVDISAAAAQEGDTGTATATFVLTLSAPSGRAVTVQAATADGHQHHLQPRGDGQGLRRAADRRHRARTRRDVRGGRLVGRRHRGPEHGHRDDHRRRPPPDARYQRRGQARGEPGRDAVHVHRHPRPGRLPAGDGQVRHRPRHG